MLCRSIALNFLQRYLTSNSFTSLLFVVNGHLIPSLWARLRSLSAVPFYFSSNSPSLYFHLCSLSISLHFLSLSFAELMASYFSLPQFHDCLLLHRALLFMASCLNRWYLSGRRRGQGRKKQRVCWLLKLCHKNLPSVGRRERACVTFTYSYRKACSILPQAEQSQLSVFVGEVLQPSDELHIPPPDPPPPCAEGPRPGFSAPGRAS